MVWEDFRRFGNLEHFRRLKRTAEPISGGWEPWRKKAFAHLRDHIKQGKRTAKKKGWDHAPDHSALVEILLDEGKVDEAWEEASGGGCHGRLWMQLAAAREKQHPADALHGTAHAHHRQGRGERVPGSGRFAQEGAQTLRAAGTQGGVCRVLRRSPPSAPAEAQFAAVAGRGGVVTLTNDPRCLRDLSLARLQRHGGWS